MYAPAHPAFTAGNPGPGTELRFDAFTVFTSRRELWRGSAPVPIGERAFDLLTALLEQPGALVSKEQLTRAAWGGRAVEASNLTVQMAALRRILGPDLVRTVSGRGYMLAAEVTPGCGADAGPCTLPAVPAEPLTQFIGRDSERLALGRLLTSHRAVCVLGLGGVGKTRLVLRMRHDLAATFPDGVPFIDLSLLSDPGQVTEAAAAALGAGSGVGSAEEAIVNRLRHRRCLLILDNAEHLIPAVRALLITILGACPAVSVLVTSRESLGIPGEANFRLLPLAVPEVGDVTAADALGFDAMRLFADRAGSLLPGFEVNDDNARHVAEICRQLDGIALAIEMAVPRLEVLTVRQLSERLHDRFRTLAAPRHDVPPRQRTLRAMFDWSWDLLSGTERAALQTVSVFAGGATLGALEALMPDGQAGPDIVDLLAGLAQKSLLVVMPPAPAARGAEPRYGVLETTRQYVLEQMAAAAAGLHRRHALYVASCFERGEAEWPRMHSAEWIGRYGPEADNLRAAMHWAFGAEGETWLALRLVAHSAFLWWELPGLPLRESRYWHQLAGSRIDERTPAGVQARLWFGLSWMDTVDGDVENFAVARRAVALFRKAGEPVGLGAALWRAASTVMFRDEHRPDAAALLAEAEQVLGGQTAPKWQALCRIRRADLLQHGGALEEALAVYTGAMATVDATGFQYGRMVCGGNRSYVLFRLGRHAEAIQGLQALRHELPPGLSWPLTSQLCMLLMAANWQAEALAATVDSLMGTLVTGMVATLGRTLEALALALALAGDAEPATILLGFVLRHHSADRVRLGPRQVVFARLGALLDGALAPERRALLLAQGESATPAEIADAAMRFCKALLQHPA